MTVFQRFFVLYSDSPTVLLHYFCDKCSVKLSVYVRRIIIFKWYSQTFIISALKLMFNVVWFGLRVAVSDVCELSSEWHCYGQATRLPPGTRLNYYKILLIINKYFIIQIFYNITYYKILLITNKYYYLLLKKKHTHTCR